MTASFPSLGALCRALIANPSWGASLEFHEIREFPEDWPPMQAGQRFRRFLQPMYFFLDSSGRERAIYRASLFFRYFNGYRTVTTHPEAC
jgi:hypothetical protein